MMLGQLEDLQKAEDKPTGIDDKRTQDVLFDPRYKEG